MENNGAFNYRYSAANNREIENIRKKYLPREESKIDRLKSLDYQVQTAGMLQGLILGIIGCLVFGIGVCFCLNEQKRSAVYGTENQNTVYGKADYRA